MLVMVEVTVVVPGVTVTLSVFVSVNSFEMASGVTEVTVVAGEAGDQSSTQQSQTGLRHQTYCM